MTQPQTVPTATDQPCTQTRRPYRGKRARAPRPGTGRRRLTALAVPLLLAAVVTASAPGLIRVHSGDTLWALARTHHTSVSAIQQANHLSGDRIYAGQLLRIPGAGTAASGSATGGGTYTVRSGDTVGALALRYHTSQHWVIATNHLPSNGFLRAGQRLTVPGTSTPSSGGSLVAGHRAELARHTQPGRATVQALVASTARRYGVDPTLALSIALQESGFQQGVVSGADAIGVMQLLPSTAAWLSADVAGRRLDPMNAADNITGGVLLLRSLLRATSTANAIGAYYQGLGSIQEHGMYADTKAYVHAVQVNQNLFR